MFLLPHEITWRLHDIIYIYESNRTIIPVYLFKTFQKVCICSLQEHSAEEKLFC